MPEQAAASHWMAHRPAEPGSGRGYWKATGRKKNGAAGPRRASATSSGTRIAPVFQVCTRAHLLSK